MSNKKTDGIRELFSATAALSRMIGQPPNPIALAEKAVAESPYVRLQFIGDEPRVVRKVRAGRPMRDINAELLQRNLRRAWRARREVIWPLAFMNLYTVTEVRAYGVDPGAVERGDDLILAPELNDESVLEGEASAHFLVELYEAARVAICGASDVPGRRRLAWGTGFTSGPDVVVVAVVVECEGMIVSARGFYQNDWGPPQAEQLVVEVTLNASPPETTRYVFWFGHRALERVMDTVHPYVEGARDKGHRDGYVKY
ncbi:MAG: hypothetical protein ABIZ50_03860 [Solirubrobacterales bacterium]